MTRNEPVTIYVSESEKNRLKAEANDAGETLSSYAYKLMQAERERRGVDQAAADLSPEERIEALIADATDALEETAEDIRDLNARAGVYSIANFELLKGNYPDARRAEVLETGSRRLRYPLDQHADMQADADADRDADADAEAPEDGAGSDDGSDDSDDSDGPTGAADLL